MSINEMQIISKPDEVQNIARKWKKDGISIGLVPTMGYLHDGHRSLIQRACRENDKVIVSVFLNPIQFGENEDLSSYPRDFDADAAMCREEGVAILFHPEPSDMYGDNFMSHVEVEKLTGILCGRTRPTHFRGVTTVVNKLFNISKADRAYFGEKDAQQLAVIRRMVTDLNIDIEICGCPTVREIDGLAKSSRNKYLSAEERKAATILSQALAIGRKMLDEGERDAGKIKTAMISAIENEPLSNIDYVSIVDSNFLTTIQGTITDSVLVALAVKIGSTRLIDNFTYEITQ